MLQAAQKEAPGAVRLIADRVFDAGLARPDELVCLQEVLAKDDLAGVAPNAHAPNPPQFSDVMPEVGDISREQTVFGVNFRETR